jgi:hypothetical protein
MAEAATLCDKAATACDADCNPMRCLALTLALALALALTLALTLTLTLTLTRWPTTCTRCYSGGWTARPSHCAGTRSSRRATPTTYYGAHYLLWRARLTMARTTYDGAHYLLWRALLTMAGELHSLKHGSSTHYGRGAELQAAVLTILTMAGCGRDGGLARLVVQDPGARAAARLDRGRG